MSKEFENLKNDSELIIGRNSVLRPNFLIKCLSTFSFRFNNAKVGKAADFKPKFQLNSDVIIPNPNVRVIRTQNCGELR